MTNLTALWTESNQIRDEMEQAGNYDTSVSTKSCMRFKKYGKTAD